MYAQDRILDFLLPFLIGIPLAIVGGIFIVVIVWKSFKRGKEFNLAMSKLQVPPDIQKKAERAIDNYVPYKVSIDEILKNLSIIKTSEFYTHTPSGNKTVFQMYPLLSWDETFNRKNSFLKCFSYARIKNLNIFDYNFISQYASIKIAEGLIESYFANGKMSIVFNNKLCGYFDFNKHELYDSSNSAIGTFTVPNTTKLRSIYTRIGGFNYGQNFEVKAEIFIKNNKSASILLQASTDDEFELAKQNDKNMDFNMFSELNTKSLEESILVLGFGVSFYALLENTRPDQPVTHSV